MPSQRWRKIRYYRYFLHAVLGNSFGRTGPFANTDPAKLTRCKRAVILTYSAVTSHLGLLLILIVHSFVGAAIFQVIEGNTGRPSGRSLMTSQRQKLVDNLADELIDSGLVSPANRTQLKILVRSYFKDYEDWMGDESMLLLRPAAADLWDLWGSLYFCLTVYSTIGYGNLFPVTTLGRWITIVYAVIGIPIFLITVADLGLLLTKIARAVSNWASEKCCSCKSKDDDKLFTATNKAPAFKKGSRNSVADVNAPVSDNRDTSTLRGQDNIAAEPVQGLTPIEEEGQQTVVRHARGFINKAASQANLDGLVIEEETYSDVVGQKLDEKSEQRISVYIPVILTLIYALGIVGVLTQWESWTFTEAFYFVFISFSTIGFGDITPVHRNYFLASSALILIGLVLVAMVISVLTQLINDTLGAAKGKANALAEKKFGVQIPEHNNSV